MLLRYLPGLLVLPLLPIFPMAADDKNTEPVRAGNEAVDVRATAIVGREPVKAILGVDPGTEIIALEVEVRSRSDALIAISRDDFILISRKDGQRSPGLHPSQIAGSGSIIVSSTAQGASGGMLGPRRGPVWGGIPGTGGRPQRIGTDNDVASITEAETRSSVSDKKETVDNPVLAALKKKELPQTSSADPVRGYLYFIFEGKHKLKDLELMYKTPQGNLMLDFKK